MPLPLGWPGWLWALPNSVLGFLIGVAGLPWGTRLRRGDNALYFLGHPLMRYLPAKAITFGHCVLFRPGVEPRAVVGRYDGQGRQCLSDHEYAHTLQYERWGPLFLPVYLLLALGPKPHPLECQADRWAARRRREDASDVA